MSRESKLSGVQTPPELPFISSAFVISFGSGVVTGAPLFSPIDSLSENFNSCEFHAAEIKIQPGTSTGELLKQCCNLYIWYQEQRCCFPTCTVCKTWSRPALGLNLQEN